MEIRDSKGKSWETDNLTLQELEVLYADILDVKLKIQAELDYIEAEASETGKFIDRRQFAKKKAALRYKISHEVFLRALIASEKKKAKSKPLLEPNQTRREELKRWKESVANHFIRVVEEWADEKTFKACMDEAKRRATAEKEG